MKMWLKILLNVTDGKGNMTTSQPLDMFTLSTDSTALPLY
jgi:hypothetical protein